MNYMGTVSPNGAKRANANTFATLRWSPSALNIQEDGADEKSARESSEIRFWGCFWFCVCFWVVVFWVGELCRAENEAKKAKLALVLGSSLQIVPSGDLPLLTIPDARYKKRKRSSLSSSGGKNKKTVTRKTTGGQLAIVNLQATEKDQFADLVVHAKTDQVMLQVAKYLNIEIPDYVRKDAFGVRYVAHASNEDNEDKRIHLKVQIVSQHFESDHDIPVPWLEDIDVKSIPKWVKVKNLEQETKRVGGLFVCKTFEFMRMFSDFLNDDDDDEEIVFEIKPNARLNSSPTISTTRSSRALQRLLERVTKGEKLTLSSCEESETIDNIETHVVRYQQKR